MALSSKSLLKRTLLIGSLLSTFVCLSHAEAVSPRQLVEVADFSSPVVSPENDRVAFRLEQASIERNTYHTVWYVQSMDGASPPRRIAGGGVPLRDSAGVSLRAIAVWSPDGRWIYYRALMDGKIDVWRAAVDGSGAEPVTLDTADVRDFALSADGQVLKYSVGASREAVMAAEQAEYDRGIRIDETVPIGQGLFRSGYIEGRLATQRLRVNDVERFPLLADMPDRWKAVDLTTGTKQDLALSDIPSKPLAASDFAEGIAEPWKITHDPLSGRIALLTRVGDEDGLLDKPDVKLSMLPGVKDRQPVECIAEQCTNKAITNVLWRPKSDEVLFTVTDPQEAYAQSILRWNVKTGVVRPVVYARGTIGGGGRFQAGNCGLSSVALVCVAAEADRPPRLEKIDLETGNRQVLFDPNAALARDMTQNVPARLLRWTDARGQVFTGQFFAARNAGDAPSPLFVSYYRCLGFARGGFGDEWPLATLAKQGVSALCINAAPYRLEATERYDAGRSAVESVIKLLASTGEIDPARVGMGGLSFGTETTLWTVIHSDLVTAASVSSLGISQQFYLLLSMQGDSFFPRLRKYWQLGAPNETPEGWQAISPGLNLDKIRSPILMQLPEQEFIHTLDYSISLMRDHRADVYVFPNEPHQKFQPKHKLAVYERNLDWFRFWLQGFEDHDPSKAEQYKHWREMRTRLNERAKAPSAP